LNTDNTTQKSNTSGLEAALEYIGFIIRFYFGQRALFPEPFYFIRIKTPKHSGIFQYFIADLWFGNVFGRRGGIFKIAVIDWCTFKVYIQKLSEILIVLPLIQKRKIL